MYIAKVSSQNQITLPKALLSALGVETRGHLLLEMQEKKLIIKPLTTSIIDQVAKSLAIPRQKLGLSEKTIMAKTRRLVARHLAHEN